MAVGFNEDGQCKISEAQGDTTYTQVSARGSHTVLRQSDGKVIAVGFNEDGHGKRWVYDTFATVTADGYWMWPTYEWRPASPVSLYQEIISVNTNGFPKN